MQEFSCFPFLACVSDLRITSFPVLRWSIFLVLICLPLLPHFSSCLRWNCVGKMSLILATTRSQLSSASAFVLSLG